LRARHPGTHDPTQNFTAQLARPIENPLGVGVAALPALAKTEQKMPRREVFKLTDWLLQMPNHLDNPFSATLLQQTQALSAKSKTQGSTTSAGLVQPLIAFRLRATSHSSCCPISARSAESYLER
jgi:hypothetical protein